MANLNSKVSPTIINERLSGIDYPASKQELIIHASEGGSKNDEVVKVLNELPEMKYNSRVDLNREIGKIQ